MSLITLKIMLMVIIEVNGNFYRNYKGLQHCCKIMIQVSHMMSCLLLDSATAFMTDGGEAANAGTTWTSAVLSNGTQSIADLHAAGCWYNPSD